MRWYKLSKFGLFNSFRNHTSKLIHKNPNQRTTHSYTTLRSSSFSTKKQNAFEFPVTFQYRLKKTYQFIPFRCYGVNRNQVYNFFWNKKWLLRSSVLVIGCCLYAYSLETIPVIKRVHFVPFSYSLETQFGKVVFYFQKIIYKGKILPAIHPESVRINLIANNIIESLQRGVKKGIEDQEKGVQVATEHLERLNWEILVVNDPNVFNAFSLPGGKIVLFTGLLRICNSDSEIATIIGHEVAHIVARHNVEKVSMVNKAAERYRRMELEADYIGILLMAGAGYDPRVALTVCKKFEILTQKPDLKYPSWEKRAQMLVDNVMDEAFVIYKEVHEGRDVKGFLCH